MLSGSLFGFSMGMLTWRRIVAMRQVSFEGHLSRGHSWTPLSDQFLHLSLMAATEGRIFLSYCEHKLVFNAFDDADNCRARKPIPTLRFFEICSILLSWWGYEAAFFFPPISVKTEENSVEIKSFQSHFSYNPGLRELRYSRTCVYFSAATDGGFHPKASSQWATCCTKRACAQSHDNPSVWGPQRVVLHLALRFSH